MLGTATLGLLALSAPALADELDDLFDRAAEAEFSGTKFVHCETPDGVVSQITDIKQSEGVAVIRAKTADSEVIAKKGEYGDRQGDYSRVAIVTAAGSPDRAERYTLIISGVARELGRRITAVQVLEGRLLRVSLGFDASTGAVLRTETFNAEGSTYCISEFISFVEGPPLMDVASMASAERTQLVAYEGFLDERELPESAGGFTRVDVYSGTADTIVGYYSDGVFSFTLVRSDSPLEIPELQGLDPVEIEGYEYQRAFFPGQAVLVWDTPDGGYALVTDAPLDMQTAVLGGLPKPGKAFFLARWWQALTGGR